MEPEAKTLQLSNPQHFRAVKSSDQRGRVYSYLNERFAGSEEKRTTMKT